MEKSKSCQDKCLFLSRKNVIMWETEYEKKSRKNVLNHDWINWKKHFQEKIMEKPSGKKRYQGRNCFYHMWKKWKNVRGVHKSWEWKTVKTFQEENVFPRRKSLSCEKLNTKSFNICKQTNKKFKKKRCLSWRNQAKCSLKSCIFFVLVIVWLITSHIPLTVFLYLNTHSLVVL